MPYIALERRVSAYHTAVADAKHAREEMYRAIRREHAKGVSLRELARVTGLTYGRVGQIVQEGKAAG